MADQHTWADPIGGVVTGSLHVGELIWHDEPVVADQSPAGGPDPLLAVGSESNISDTGMLSGQ